MSAYGKRYGKKAIADLRSQQKHYKQITMKIRKDSGIIEALEAYEKKTGIAPATYAQNALKEKLIQDGYDPDHYKPDPE